MAWITGEGIAPSTDNTAGNVTEITPQSIAADQETPAERPASTDTWRVLKRDEGTIPQVKKWVEEEPISGSGQWGFWPHATEVGEKYGEGEYLLFRVKGDNPSIITASQTLRVVADRVYRLADDETTA